MPTEPKPAETQPIPEGWETLADPTIPEPRRSPRRRRLAGASIVAALSLGLFVVSALLSGNNKASALTGHPEVLRPGCSWDSSGNYVQNCKVWSPSQNRYVIVQVRASNGSDKGIYLLDGMRAREDRSGWTTDVQAAKVYDGSTDTTLVMPVGGASSFYTDWQGGAGSSNTTIKEETFLTSELPDYLSQQFGVSKSNNAIIGLSMSGGPAVTLAEKHPDQFKVVQAMSGYYQTDNPIGALGVLAAQTTVSNYINGIVNMWGPPGSARWAENDPSKNVNKLKENGQVLIISSGNGFLTSSEMAKLSPSDQFNAMALEMLSAVSTVLMQMQAAQSGASVISLPEYGGHTWENWGRALTDGKSHVLDGLNKTPPVTNKVQVVNAAGTANPQALTAATKAAALVATSAPVVQNADASPSAVPSSTDATTGSPAAPKAGATTSAAAPSTTSTGQPSTTTPVPTTTAPSAPTTPSTTQAPASTSAPATSASTSVPVPPAA